MRHFRIRLAGFMNLKFFFIRDQMANTNAKTPHFRRSVNEPLKTQASYYSFVNKMVLSEKKSCFKASSIYYT